MNTNQPHLQKGCLIEYLQDNQPILGWILEDKIKSFSILNINKRILKINIPRILPWTGPHFSGDYSREDILEQLAAHHNLRHKIKAEINPVLIWEMAQGEIESAPANWFAELIWDAPNCDQVAAMGHCLLEFKTHFKFQPPNFLILNQELVTKRLQLQEQERLQQELIARGQDFLQKLWKQNQPGNKTIPPIIPEQVQNSLKKLLLLGIANPEHNEFKKIWKILSKGLPEHPHLPLILAEYWGIVQKHYNYLLDQEEYAWGDEWSRQFPEQLLEAKKRFSELALPAKDLALLSIDSESTQDIDDAFSISKQGSLFCLKLALACPGLIWEFDTPLDQEVSHRASSLYLPEGTSHMLPEAIGIKLCSLQARQWKPVLLLELVLDEQGVIQDINLELIKTKLQNNLTYKEVEQLLTKKNNRFLDQALELATLLRTNRINQGAVIFEQSEPVLSLAREGNKLKVKLKQGELLTNSHLIVSEFMILANSAIALWANKHSLPLLFRTQDITLSPESAGLWQDPVKIYTLMREMAGAKIDTTPRPHASLGVQAYAPITSPLRRYLDLMNQGQIVHFLLHGRPKWEREKLEKKIPYLSSRAGAVTRIQRFRSRYWKLLYLQSWCKKKQWPAVIVGEEERHVIISLPREQIYIRGPKKIFGDKIMLGQRLEVRLGKIDPLTNDIKILNTWEA